MLCGGAILGIMILPIITAISRDVLRQVPRAQIEGTVALGATWWQSSWEMLKYGRSALFGAVMLGPALGDVTWAIAAYAVLSLTLVRVVPVGIAMLGTDARRPTVAFLGWFGPRGAASIVFALLVVQE